MRRFARVFVFMALVLPAVAHRLDEYLQAGRFALGLNEIELRMDLTPGVAITPKLLPDLDPNHDGKITAAEQKAYAERLRQDLHVELDRKPLRLEVRGLSFPSRAEMEQGEGVIHVKLTAPSGQVQLQPGRHELFFRNDHRPELSVYLVNALVPEDRHITIQRQERNSTQREYRLIFEVKATT